MGWIKLKKSCISRLRQGTDHLGKCQKAHWKTTRRYPQNRACQGTELLLWIHLADYQDPHWLHPQSLLPESATAGSSTAFEEHWTLRQQDCSLAWIWKSNTVLQDISSRIPAYSVWIQENHSWEKNEMSSWGNRLFLKRFHFSHLFHKHIRNIL